MSSNGKPCPYCMRVMLSDHPKLKPSQDHIRSRKRFPAKVGRIIMVCSECNFMKAHYTLAEFIQYLKLKNEGHLKMIQTNLERIENISYLIRIGLEEEGTWITSTVSALPSS